jgi:hypothetical protein
VGRLDHLIVVAPSLESGMAEIEERLGVRPSAGGRHEGRGTQNALLSLGEGQYLELLTPDPQQSLPVERRFLCVSEQTRFHVATWVAKASNLDEVQRAAEAAGVPLGEPREGGRRRADGTVLAWRSLGADAPRLDGMIPFFIDWGDTPHPSSAAARGCTLREMRAEHPDAERVAAALRALGLDLEVSVGEKPCLMATIECPRGIIELR